MPADPEILNPLEVIRVSNLDAASEARGPWEYSASGMRSALLTLPRAGRVLKSVTIAEDANVIEYFSQWGAAAGADFMVIERQNYSDALQALERAESNLLDSEKYYDEAFEYHCAMLDANLFVIDENGRKNFLREALKPYIENIWRMKNAVDHAAEAADAAWDRIQLCTAPMPVFAPGNQAGENHQSDQLPQPAGAQVSELAERWQSAKAAYLQALDEHDAAAKQFAQARDAYDHFKRGSDEWLEQETLAANANLGAATEHFETTEQDYKHARIMLVRELAKNDQAHAAGTELSVRCQAAQQRLVACLTAHEMARTALVEAAEFVHSRPEHLQRFMNARIEELSEAENLLQSAQEQLDDSLVALNEISAQWYANTALLPAGLARIDEGPQDWEAVAWPQPAEANADQCLPGQGDVDVELAAVHSLDELQAWQAF